MPADFRRNRALQVNPETGMHLTERLILGLPISIRRYAQKLHSVSLADLCRRLALLFFALTLVTIPLRYRWTLQSRPAPPLYSDYLDFLLFPSDLFLIFSLLFWFSSLVLKPGQMRTGPASLTLPLLLVTLVGWVSTFGSVDPPLSVYHASRLLFLAGFYVFVLNETSTAGLVLPVVIQAALQAIIGIAQVLYQSSLGLGQFGELPLDPARPGISIVLANGQRFLRAYGLTDHPNILGGCLAFSLILILGYFGKAARRKRLWLSAAFILISYCLVLTFSRSAWLALAVGGLFIFLGYLAAGQKRAAATLGMLVITTGVILLPLIWQIAPYLGARLNLNGSFKTVPHEIQSLGERTLLINAARHIVANHAWLGVGLGTTPISMRQAYPDFSVNYQPAHFVLLDVAAETGLLGAVSYLALLTAPWLVLVKNRKKLVFSAELWTASALLLASTVIGMLDYYTWLLAPGRLWQWLIWGLWASAYHKAFHNGEYA